MGNICDVLQLETGKMQAYQGSEEAEAHYEEYKKKRVNLPLLALSLCVCPFVCCLETYQNLF